MSIFEMSEKEIITLVTPIVDSMQIGWDTDDYEMFSEYFSKEMKSDVNISNFERQRSELIPELGKHLKMNFVATHTNPDNVIVMWRLFFEKREIPTLVTYIFSENNGSLKISGAMLQS